MLSRALAVIAITTSAIACRSAVVVHPLDLAPADTELAILVHPQALEVADRALQQVRAAGQKHASVVGVARAADLVAAELYGSTEASSLYQAGLTPRKPMAVFVTPAGRVTVWPVSARARFVALRRGELRDGRDHVGSEVCAPLGGHYVCTPDIETLSHLGGSDLRKRLDRAEPGDIQILLGERDPREPTSSFGVTFQRGQVTVRGAIANLQWPSSPFARAARPDPDGASAFFSLAVAPTSTSWSGIPPVLRELLADTTGRLSLRVPFGARAFIAEIPIVDHTRIDERIAACDVGSELPGLVTKLDGGACRIGPRGIPIRVDGDLVRIGETAVTGLRRPRLAPGTLADLLEAEWSVAMWARGSLTNLDEDGLAWFPGGPQLGHGGVGLLSEVVAGAEITKHESRVVAAIRTIFAHSEDETEALLTLLDRRTSGEDIAAPLAALAQAHPSTPLASDIAASGYGLQLSGDLIRFAITAYSLFTDDAVQR